MAKSKAERRREIYLVAKKVFFGDRSLIRERSQLSKVVARNQDYFKPIISEYTGDVVLECILNFLKEGLFESESKAKLVFPDLFQPKRSLQHENLEKQTPQLEKKALKNVNHPDHTNQVDIVHRSTQKPEAAKTCSLQDPPLPFPTYLTYTCQHALMGYVQALLELCCYSFSLKSLPSLLEQNSWNSPLCIELSKWPQILPDRFDDLPEGSTVARSATEMKDTLGPAYPIRNVAVHREPKTANEIVGMLGQAIAIAEMLKDEHCMIKLETLKQHLLATIKDLETQKNIVDCELGQKLDEIQTQRKNLDLEEAMLKSTIMDQNQENTSRICSMFESSLAELDSLDGCPLDSSRNRYINGGSSAGEESDTLYFSDLELTENPTL